MEWRHRLVAVLVIGLCHLAGPELKADQRHIVGGRKDEVTGNALRAGCYAACSSMNRRHQLFAWLSLFSVGFADIYVRLCSMGVWTDYRLL